MTFTPASSMWSSEKGARPLNVAENWLSTIQPEISHILKTRECQKTKSWENSSDRALWRTDAKRLHSAIPLRPAWLDLLSMADSVLFHVLKSAEMTLESNLNY